jgi:hypothetical protein
MMQQQQFPPPPHNAGMQPPQQAPMPHFGQGQFNNGQVGGGQFGNGKFLSQPSVVHSQTSHLGRGNFPSNFNFQHMPHAGSSGGPAPHNGAYGYPSNNSNQQPYPGFPPNGYSNQQNSQQYGNGGSGQ